MSTNVFHGDKGLSLTEVAVATALLGIFLIAFLPIMVNSIGLAQSNSEVGQANRIVSSQLDTARGSLLGDSCVPEQPASPDMPNLTLEAPDSERFAAQRIVVCNGEATLATVTINVMRNTDLTQVISSATTQVVTTS